MILTSKQDTSQNYSFPTFQLFVLALCRIAEPIALTSIFPYAFPMVRSFLGEANPNNALYTGILISSFSLAEATTAVYWGAISDKVGRKPVLLLGLFGTMISLVMTGLAPSFTFALIARLVGGFLNGNIGVIQTMVGELVKDPDHEPRAFAVMPFVWCIGSIIGPAIAGITSNSTLFPDFPYLLPNLIGAGVLLVSIIVGAFFLQETLQVEAIPAEKRPLLTPTPSYCQASHDEAIPETYGTFNWVNVDQGAAPVSSPGEILKEKSTDKVFSKQVLLLILALCLWCYHSMAYDHLLPVFLQDDQPEDVLEIGKHLLDIPGGLGLSTQDVGIVMAVNGLIALLIQGIVFPIMTDTLGVWHTFIIVTVLHPIAYIIVPYIAFLPQHLLFPGIYLCLIIRNLFYIPAYPILLILIKEAADPKHLGRVNGLAASAGAIARMLGPPIGGLLYSIGARFGFTGLAWWATGLVALFGSFQVFQIKRNQNARSTVSTPFDAVNETTEQPRV